MRSQGFHVYANGGYAGWVFEMKYVLVYYTQSPKDPVIFYEKEMEAMLAEVVRLTQSKAKFAIFRIGECVGDYS